MKVSEIENYMAAHDLDSVIIGKHSRHDYFIALRTSRTRGLTPNHGRGESAEAALNDLISQDAGLARPVPERPGLSEAVPAARTTKTEPAPTTGDDYEDLLG